MRKVGGETILLPSAVSLRGWGSTAGERFRLPGPLGCDKQLCGPSEPSLLGPISAALAKALGKNGGKRPKVATALRLPLGTKRTFEQLPASLSRKWTSIQLPAPSGSLS